jgi:hypothetical protein
MNSFKYLFASVLFFNSCNFNPNDKVVPEWEIDMLAPLIKADLNIQDIAQLDSLHAGESLSLSDFGVIDPGIPVIIPAVPPSDFGPYGISLTDAYASAELESGSLYYTITNELEINVKSNTTIIIKDGGNPILSDNIPSDIAAFTGAYTSPVTNLANTTVSASLTFEIQNFSSDGSGGGFVTIDPNRKLTIDIYLKNVKVKSITIGSSNNFSITDTSDFSISGSNISSQSVSGVFNTFITNNLPLGFNFQIYFMDETKTIKLDSLFDSPTPIPPASGSVPSETKFVTSLSSAKINNLNNSSFARTMLELNAPATTTIQNNVYLNLQIVGDLKLKLAN